MFIEKIQKILKLDSEVRLYKLIVAEIILTALLNLFTLLLFITLSKNTLRGDLIYFDDIVTEFVFSFRSTFLTSFFYLVTLFGNQVIATVTVLFALLLLWKKRKQEALIFSMIVSANAALNLLIKYITHRPRPVLDPLIVESFYSFPSGHAMNAFNFYIVFTYFVFRLSRNKQLGIIMGIFSALIIILVGISRVYLGVHYPSDVVAGYLASIWWILTILVISKTLSFYNLVRQLRLR